MSKVKELGRAKGLSDSRAQFVTAMLGKKKNDDNKDDYFWRRIQDYGG